MSLQRFFVPKFQLNLRITLALSILGCDGPGTDGEDDKPQEPVSANDSGTDSDTDTGTDPVVDTTPPSVMLTSPLDGATLAGTASLTAAATDDIGVVSVTFLVDGIEVAVDDATPYEATWETVGAANGNYRLSAVAKDAAGNVSEVTANAYVQNDGGLSSDAIRIINPVDGASVCGRLTVEAAVSLDSATVVFSLDGTDVATDSSAPFTWDWNTESTSNGLHSLRATATDADGATVQNTIFLEIANTGGDCDNLPSVSFTSPESGVYTNGDVALAADASDDVGVLKVQFFMDNGLLVEDNGIPYETVWASGDFDEGVHSLKAIAYDTASQSSETRITVTIDRTAPVVEITAPGDDDQIEGTVNIEASVDENLAIDWVTMAVDGDVIATLTGAPYAVDWDTLDVDYGAHEIEVVATDRAGNVGVDIISVNVDNPPSVHLDDPNDGDTVNGTLEVEATASDDGGVSSVAFYLDGSRQTTDSASPYGWNWDTCDVAKGNYVLEARATDGGGHEVADSATVTVDQALEVELVGPTGTLDVDETLTAHVSDDDAIASVVFELDGIVLATVSSSSGTADECALSCECDEYSAAWDVSSVAEGTHTLSVTVTNSAGDTGMDSYSVTVDYDADGDGFAGVDWGGEDCDEGNAAVNPAASEIVANGDDEDCDGVDSCYEDLDGDNYGTSVVVDGSTLSCETGDGTTVSSDCDDWDSVVNPGEVEVCGNGADDDCDGTTEGDGLDSRVGLVFHFVLADGTITEPSGIGPILLGNLTADMTSEITAIDACDSNIGMTLTDSGAGVPSNFDGAFDPDPYFETQAPELSGVLGSTPFVWEAATWSGTLRGDHGGIDDAVFSGLMNTSTLAPEFGSTDPDFFCDLVPSFGVACEPCGDGKLQCLRVTIEDLTARP